MTAPVLLINCDLPGPPYVVDPSGSFEIVIAGYDDGPGPIDVLVQSPLLTVYGNPFVNGTYEFTYDTLDGLGKNGEFGFGGQMLLETLKAGAYDFKATVTDDEGLSTSVSVSVQVPHMVAAVGADIVYLPQGAHGFLDPEGLGLLTGNDTMTPGYVGWQGSLMIAGTSGSAGVAVSQGVYTVDPAFAGVAHLKQAVSVLDFADTTIGDLTVSVAALGPKGYGCVRGTAAGELFFYDAVNAPVSIAAGGGDDWVYASQGGGSYNGEAGNDFIRGGNGNDVITGGQGADTLFGGGGADTFIINKGDIAPGDVIADFEGAGDGWRPGEDMIRFQGFSAAAHVVHVAGSAIYTLVDGNIQADFEIDSVNGGDLGKGDYGFY